MMLYITGKKVLLLLLLFSAVVLETSTVTCDVNAVSPYTRVHSF